KVIEFATKALSLEPPWDLELGLAGVKGLYLNPGNFWSTGQLGPVQKTEISYRSSVRDSKVETLNELLLSFFSIVFDSVGERRPRNLHGFPPNRPTPPN